MTICFISALCVDFLVVESEPGVQRESTGQQGVLNGNLDTALDSLQSKRRLPNDQCSSPLAGYIPLTYKGNCNLPTGTPCDAYRVFLTKDYGHIQAWIISLGYMTSGNIFRRTMAILTAILVGTTPFFLPPAM